MTVRSSDDKVVLVVRAGDGTGGAIDTDFIKTSLSDVYARKTEDGIFDPEHIAENYLHLHRQPRDSWTFELDLRPYSQEW
jgi:hypothetical protein